jgi:hypothetical protein
LAAPRPSLSETSTILDGRGGVLTNRQIVIEGGRISSIGAGKARATYDLRGLTVMPGWIDTHVHLNWHFEDNHKLVNGPLARFAIECNSRAMEAYRIQTGETGISLPDPVAMSIALDPTVCTSVSRHYVDVEVSTI